MLAGRGFGKTRTGAEWVRSIACGKTPLERGQAQHIAIIAETAKDARDVMIGDGRISGEGSGLLQVHPKDFMPIYEPSKRRLTWPNGCVASIYNGSEPDQLRGPQHSHIWADELAKWQYSQEAWDQAQFGLRLGSHPRVLVSTTPRPIKLIKDILKDSMTHVTMGSTLENSNNLASQFVDTIIRKYAGTRLGRQEIYAEILDDVPGAMWNRERLEELRLKASQVPPLKRIVVAIDPAMTSGEDADETGIIVAGIDYAGNGYVLADESGVMSPNEWATVAVKLYAAHGADRIIGETNNGGDMIESTIRAVNPNVAYKGVHASRGKAIRAEPVSALYEQRRIHHIGNFHKLEDQMCSFTQDFDRSTAGYSPDRLDACLVAGTLISTDRGLRPIETVAVGDYVLTRKGYRRVTWSGMTNPGEQTYDVTFSDGSHLLSTTLHPIYVDGKGFVPVDALMPGDRIVRCSKHRRSNWSWMAGLTAAIRTVLTRTTKDTTLAPVARDSEPTIETSGQSTTVQSRKITTSITRMKTFSTTISRITSVFLKKSTALDMPTTASCVSRGVSIPPKYNHSQKSGMDRPRGSHGTASTESRHGKGANAYQLTSPAPTAAKQSRPSSQINSLRTVNDTAHEGAIEPSQTKTKDTNIRSIVRSIQSLFGKISISLNRRLAPVYVERVCAAGVESVFNLHVDTDHEFFANGVLVHNCVWALTELMLGDTERKLFFA